MALINTILKMLGADLLSGLTLFAIFAIAGAVSIALQNNSVLLIVIVLGFFIHALIRGLLYANLWGWE